MRPRDVSVRSHVLLVLLRRNVPVKETIAIGSLVFPVEDRCGKWVRILVRNGNKQSWKREFIYTGAIRVCKTPHRERPEYMSQDMDLGTPGIVAERLEGRFPLLRIITVNGNGSPVNGWVMASDVQLSSPEPQKQ